MVAHEKRNSSQLFCAVPTRNDLALSSLLFPAQPTQKLEYPEFAPQEDSLLAFSNYVREDDDNDECPLQDESYAAEEQEVE